jgi:hypothetical protein
MIYEPPAKDWVKQTQTLLDLPLLEFLPRDTADFRYVVSFPSENEEEIANFFNEYGFVVIKDVFSVEECERTRSAMWEIIEEKNPAVSRDDPLSWKKFKNNGRYGLSIRGPSFHPTLVLNRYQALFTLYCSHVCASFVYFPF